MDALIYKKHLDYGKAAGIERTCGSKQKHANEDAATKAADNLNKSPKRHNDVEPYPCYFCGMWHIGRKMDMAT